MKPFLLLSLLAFFLVACDGSDSSSTSSNSGDSGVQTGSFIDAPVKGLSYTASPSGRSGTTNQNGEFEYLEGDEVSFSVGSIALGKSIPGVDKQVKVTSLDAGMLVAQLLQTLDIEPIVDALDVGGIVIPEAVATAISAKLSANDNSVDVLSSAELDSIKAANPSNSVLSAASIVSKQDVLAHIELQIGQQGLAFNTTELTNRLLVASSVLTEYDGSVIRFEQEGDNFASWLELENNGADYSKQPWSISSDNLVFAFQEEDGSLEETCTLSKLAEDNSSVDISYSCSGGDLGLMGFLKPQPFQASDLDGKTFSLVDLEANTESISFDSGLYSCGSDSCRYESYSDGQYANSVWLAKSGSLGDGTLLVLVQGSLSNGRMLAISFDVDGNFELVEVFEVLNDSLTLEFEGTSQTGSSNVE
jgi:hypothetical protein